MCESRLNDRQCDPGGSDVIIFSCPICGDVTLSNTLVSDSPSTKKVRRAIRKIQESNKDIELYTTLGKVLENSLPKPKEQADTFNWVRPKKA